MLCGLIMVIGLELVLVILYLVAPNVIYGTVDLVKVKLPLGVLDGPAVSITVLLTLKYVKPDGVPTVLVINTGLVAMALAYVLDN